MTKRNYYYDRHLGQSILLDDFGEPYYALHEEDEVKNYSISLPLSLMLIIDQKRKDISRSRFIRKLIENGLKVERC